MPEGWETVIGIIIGAILTGLAIFLNSVYQHSKFREKHIQDILICERIDKYKELNILLTKLWWDLPFPQIALKELNSISTKKRLEKIKEYVIANSLFFVPKVQYVFWEYFGEFQKWCSKVSHCNETELFKKCPSFEEKIKETLENLLSCTRQAMIEDLKIHGFKTFSFKEIRSSYKKGIKRVEKCLGEEKE